MPRVRQHSGPGIVYGEKNLTLGPFVKALYSELGCKFILLVRDGRDVVRSLINWHERKFGNIYRECREAGNLSRAALLSAASLLVYDDSSDYSRPRPQRGSRLSDEWENLSRAEMCAYYWATVNDLFMRNLQQVPRDAWVMIDYTKPVPSAIENVAEFCGVRGLSSDEIARLLEQRINSLKDRGESDAGGYPHWSEWDSRTCRGFDRIAGDTMRSLGYYTSEKAE